MSNAIIDIERGLPEVDAIPDSFVSGITERISEQLEAWSGKKESDPSMLDTLRAYWDSVGWTNWGGNTDIPWSAAFVSHVLGGDFPAESAHRKYVQRVIDEDDNAWQAFSVPKNIERLRLRPGDVLVKPRSGGWGNSHGAVVYRIRDGVAELAGGNVSNTAKIEDEIPVDPEGRPTEGMGPWLVVLKRPGSGFSLLKSAGAALAMLLAYLGLRGANG